MLAAKIYRTIMMIKIILKNDLGMGKFLLANTLLILRTENSLRTLQNSK